MSPAAVSERAEPGVRGGLHPPELGLRQFRLCSPSGGAIVRAWGQKWWGRIQEGVTGGWKWVEDLRCRERGRQM